MSFQPSNPHLPLDAIIGLSVFAIGSVGCHYAGFKAKGWAYLLPFTDGNASKIYLKGIRESDWPRWPLYLWFLSLPVALFFSIKGGLEWIHPH